MNERLRQTIRVTGRVQGVGFRPFVHRLALALRISGNVRNQSGVVLIKAEASAEQLRCFTEQLATQAPTASQVDMIEVCDETTIATNDTSQTFEIDTSQNEQANAQQAGFPIDYAPCNDCLKEFNDPTNHRYRYPFIACAECGPRYSITKALPFDRERTSMHRFPLCEHCYSEYQDPNNRRFHAQTISCPNCGPSVSLLSFNTASGSAIKHDQEPFARLAQSLLRGEVVAIKSTGGFHLCCDARNLNAITKLRQVKHRPDKPFAVMCESLDSLDHWLEPQTNERELFNNPQTPIVLMPVKQKNRENTGHLAPNCRDLGVIRPYNGIYLNLFNVLRARTESLNAESPLLVVTSANITGEPIIEDESACIEVFKDSVSYILSHNLDITNAIEDSVIQAGEHPMLFRLGRGYAPLMLSNDNVNPNINPNIKTLALGAHEKSTVCATNEAATWLSPELGKMNSVLSCRRLDQQIQQFMPLMGHQPNAIAHDLHPDFRSSVVAENLSKHHQLMPTQVPHHFAHIYAVMNEHNLEPPCLGLALDGYGYGCDGESWGGELIHIKAGSAERLGHITPLALTGGDQASRNPVRCAHAALSLLGEELAAQYTHQVGLDALDNTIQFGNGLKTTSMGRWFDAIAAILGFKRTTSYEAQAAIYLEDLASQAAYTQTRRPTHKPTATRVVQIEGNQLSGYRLNLIPLLKLVLEQSGKSTAAWLFHVELSDGLCRWLVSARESTGVNTVALSGGCFQNRILREQLSQQLKQQGFQVFLPEQVPCNDASISLGQAYAASRQFAQQNDKSNSSCA